MWRGAQGLRAPRGNARGRSVRGAGCSTCTSGWPSRIDLPARAVGSLRRARRAARRVPSPPRAEGAPGRCGPCSPRSPRCVELDDEGLCCGAGGAYAALHPDMAADIRARKLERSPARARRSWRAPTPAARSTWPRPASTSAIPSRSSTQRCKAERVEGGVLRRVGLMRRLAERPGAVAVVDDVVARWVMRSWWSGQTSPRTW